MRPSPPEMPPGDAPVDRMTITQRKSLIEETLARSDSERLREFKYRFSQSVVFGLPVVALQIWGVALGGRESDRWVGILQALLAGWVVYVGAAGMLVEGLLGRSPRLILDAFVAAVAIAAYLFSLLSVLHVFVDGRLWYRPVWFHVAVLVLMGWTGLRWAWWSGRLRRARTG